MAGAGVFILRVTAGLVVAAMAGTAWAGASGSGGGSHGGGTTHYVYVPVYAGNQSMIILPEGAPVHAEIELTDAPARYADAEISVGGVIAAHTLRARAARVLLAPISDGHATLAAGAVFARMSTTVTGLSLWCSIEPRHGWLAGQMHECLSEVGGAFVQHWIMQPADTLMMNDAGVARAGAMLATPVSYREAQPDERNAGLVGFRWCEGDGSTSPPRFGLSIAPLAAGDLKWSPVGTVGCRFGVWKDPADHSRVDIDGIAVTATAGGTAGSMRFRVAGQIAPIAALPGWPLEKIDLGALASPPTPPPAGPASLAPSTMLLATGAPVITASGDIAAGQAFLSLPVRHAMTGRLRNAVKVRDAFEPFVLPVGQPLFGLPGHDHNAASTIWCAPRQVPPEGGKPSLKWRTTCLAEENGATDAIDIPTAMMATTLPWSKAHVADPIDVEQGPVDLPSMTLSYAFIGFTDPELPTRFARIEVRLDWGEGPQAVKSVSAPVGPDGQARLQLLGGVMTLRPSTAPDPIHGGHKPLEHALLAASAPPRQVAPF